jgi:hypothetical protein
MELIYTINMGSMDVDVLKDFNSHLISQHLSLKCETLHVYDQTQ